MVFCGVLGIFEQQKIYMVLFASLGAEILDCEALGVEFEREDVDAYCWILFFEKGNLLCFHGIIYSGHIECGFVFKVVGEALFVDFQFV